MLSHILFYLARKQENRIFKVEKNLKYLTLFETLELLYIFINVYKNND